MKRVLIDPWNMEGGKDYEILETNLQPFFWRKVKDIIRQNKKNALQEFLFGKGEDIKPEIQGSNSIHYSKQASRIKKLEDQTEKLHNKVDSLQEKIIQFEQLFNASSTNKIIRQEESVEDENKGYILFCCLTTIIEQIERIIKYSLEQEEDYFLKEIENSQNDIWDLLFISINHSPSKNISMENFGKKIKRIRIDSSRK